MIQRRNDGSPCFFNDDDYLVYLDYLKEAAARHRCQIHCYVLMPDHVQLLVNPDAEHRLSRMLRCVGGRYVEYVNYIYQRHGAFWEHGPNATLIDSERCLLACYRSIESTPVRARLAEGPADYRWSSYNHHAHGREDAVILDHRSYLKLGATQRERQLAYHELFRQPSDDRARAETLAAANRGPAPSGDRFKNPLERLLRRARPGGGGRPGAVELAIAAA